MTTKAKAMGGSLLIRNLRFTLPLLVARRDQQPLRASVRKFAAPFTCRRIWNRRRGFRVNLLEHLQCAKHFTIMQRALATRDVSSL
jgi:hypothetical protein